MAINMPSALFPQIEVVPQVFNLHIYNPNSTWKVALYLPQKIQAVC